MFLFTYMTSPRTPSRVPLFDNKENVRPVFQMPRRRFPSNKMPNPPMRTIKRKKTSFKVRRDSPPKRKTKSRLTPSMRGKRLYKHKAKSTRKRRGRHARSARRRLFD